MNFPGHVYSITKVDPKSKYVWLLNPWGQKELTDNSKDSKKLTKRELLDHKKPKYGEFYMEIEDFFQSFNLLSICYIPGDGLAWQEKKEYGSWIPNVSAGRARQESVRLLKFYLRGGGALCVDMGFYSGIFWESG